MNLKKPLGNLKSMVGRALLDLTRMLPFVPNFLLVCLVIMRHPGILGLHIGRQQVEVVSRLLPSSVPDKSPLQTIAYSCSSNLDPAFPHNHTINVPLGLLCWWGRGTWPTDISEFKFGYYQLCGSSLSHNSAKLWISL